MEYRLNLSMIFLLAGSLAGVTGTAQAHHSWGAIYNGGEPVNINAVITGNVYRNPHDTVEVSVLNEHGETEAWRIEWRGERGRGQAVQYGLTPGDEVIIAGRTARDSDRKTIQMQTLTRVSDGLTIQAREGRGGRGRRGR
jgi:hypothetical protein